ncbi:hypothetical protein D3C87_1241930 [compost metagenome]
MFSRSTTASSTTMPTTRVSARVVSMLNEKPMSCIVQNVAIIEMGMAMPPIKVARQFRRKAKRIATASRPPMIRCSQTEWLDSLMNLEESWTVVNVAPGGRVASSFLNSFWMLSTTATVFAPDCLKMLNMTAGWLFTKPSDRGSAIDCQTLPRSPMRTRAPEGVATWKLAMSETVWNLPIARSDSSWPFSVMRPPGRFMPSALRVW